MNQPLRGKQRNLISRPFICPTWLLHPVRRGEGREAVTGAAAQPARLWEEQSWTCSQEDRRVPRTSESSASPAAPRVGCTAAGSSSKMGYSELAGKEQSLLL